MREICKAKNLVLHSVVDDVFVLKQDYPRLFIPTKLQGGKLCQFLPPIATSKRTTENLVQRFGDDYCFLMSPDAKDFYFGGCSDYHAGIRKYSTEFNYWHASTNYHLGDNKYCRSDPYSSRLNEPRQMVLSRDGERLNVIDGNNLLILDAKSLRVKYATYHDSPNGIAAISAFKDNSFLLIFGGCYLSLYSGNGERLQDVTVLWRGSIDDCIRYSEVKLSTHNDKIRICIQGLVLTAYTDFRKPNPSCLSITRRKSLTSGRILDTCKVALSPDGNRIAYNTKDSVVLATINPDDASYTIEQQFKCDRPKITPVWSQDGLVLYFRDGDSLLAVDTE